MSLGERYRFIKTLVTTSSRPPYQKEYNKLISQHTAQFRKIHNKKQFLPWHRLYLLNMENLLKKVDPRVTVPYWDWSLFSSEPWTKKVRPRKLLKIIHYINLWSSLLMCIVIFHPFHSIHPTIHPCTYIDRSIRQYIHPSIHLPTYPSIYLCSDEGTTLETSANALYTAFSISTSTLRSDFSLRITRTYFPYLSTVTYGAQRHGAWEGTAEEVPVSTTDLFVKPAGRCRHLLDENV